MDDFHDVRNLAKKMEEGGIGRKVMVKIEAGELVDLLNAYDHAFMDLPPVDNDQARATVDRETFNAIIQESGDYTEQDLNDYWKDFQHDPLVFIRGRHPKSVGLTFIKFILVNLD